MYARNKKKQSRRQQVDDDDFMVLGTALAATTESTPHLTLPSPLEQSVGVLPAAMVPDFISLIEFFERFAENLSVPSVSVGDLLSILTSPGRVELCERICVKLTRHVVELSQSAPMPCGPSYFRYEAENFYGIDALTLLGECLDFSTWEAVLHAYISHHTIRIKCTADVHRANDFMLEKGFQGLHVEDRLIMFKFLATEMLGTPLCRDAMDRNLQEIDADKAALKSVVVEQAPKRRRVASKEKARRAPTAYNMFLQDELAKFKAANPFMSHKAAFSACAQKWKALSPETVGRWNDKAKPREIATVHELQQVYFAVEDLITRVVESSQLDQITVLREPLDRLKVRMEPIGTDRLHNRYWWTPSFPERVWTERRPAATASFRPPPVAAFLKRSHPGNKAHIAVRIKAARKCVMQGLMKLEVADLQDALIKAIGERSRGERLIASNVTEKFVLVKDLMLYDADGAICDRLLRRLRRTYVKDYAGQLSDADLHMLDLVFNVESEGNEQCKLSHAGRVEILLAMNGAVNRLAADFDVDVKITRGSCTVNRSLHRPCAQAGVTQVSADSVAQQCALVRKQQANCNRKQQRRGQHSKLVMAADALSSHLARTPSGNGSGSGRKTCPKCSTKSAVARKLCTTCDYVFLPAAHTQQTKWDAPASSGWQSEEAAVSAAACVPLLAGRYLPGSTQVFNSHGIGKPNWMTKHIQNVANAFDRDRTPFSSMLSLPKSFQQPLNAVPVSIVGTSEGRTSDPAALSLMQSLGCMGRAQGNGCRQIGESKTGYDGHECARALARTRTNQPTQSTRHSSRGAIPVHVALTGWERTVLTWRDPLQLSNLPLQPVLAAPYFNAMGVVETEVWQFYDTLQAVEELFSHLNENCAREKALCFRLAKLIPQLQLAHKQHAAVAASTTARVQSPRILRRCGTDTRLMLSGAADNSDCVKLRSARDKLKVIYVILVEAASEWYTGPWPRGWGSWNTDIDQARCLGKLVILSMVLAEAVCELGKHISYSDVIIEVVVPAPVQSWRRSGDPDKLGRCSSRAGINPSVHDQAGWEGWLRRWKKAARDVTGSSLLCLLVCALRQRANLVIGKKGLASHKRKKKREDHERVPSLCEGNRIRDNVTQPAKKVKKSVLSPIIAARCAAALRTLMKKDGAFLFLEPVDRTQYPEFRFFS